MRLIRVYKVDEVYKVDLDNHLFTLSASTALLSTLINLINPHQPLHLNCIFSSCSTSQRRALVSWEREVLSWMLSISAASACEKPSMATRLNTTRYPSGSRAIRRSNSASERLDKASGSTGWSGNRSYPEDSWSKRCRW